MVLIIRKYLKSTIIPLLPEEMVSKAYLEVSNANLSAAYDLPSKTVITGELCKVESVVDLTGKEKTILEEIEGETLEFILWRSFGNLDYLYISKTSWPILRDYAILPQKYYILTVKLKEANVGGNIVELFPKRDIFEE
jgi:hypothetical protein